jgi:alpha-2-macroglobulin
VRWTKGKDRDGYADPLSLGYLAGALALMGDHARSLQTFALASANLDADAYAKIYPAWWFGVFYSTPNRDRAALAAIAAESGETDAALRLIDRFRTIDVGADKLNTQEKAWLLRAAFALNKSGKPVSLTIDGQKRDDVALPLALAPSNAAIEAGYTVANTGDRDVWRTLVIHGSPQTAPSAMEAGYALSKKYFTLDGKPVDPSHLKQNDRLIVSLVGQSMGAEDHRTVLVDMLPAGWEIEAPITRPETYSFLGPLTKAKTVEARDDRFVAAFDLGDVGGGSGDSDNDSDQDDDAKTKPLDPHQYHLAYLVRVVTPGQFVLPEAEVEDMYRPGVMARTDAGETEDDPR